MFIRERVHALQLDQQALADYEIGYIFADEAALLGHPVGNLGARRYPAQRKFLYESAFVDLLQKTRTQGVGDFIGGSDYGIEKGVEGFAVFLSHNDSWWAGWGILKERLAANPIADVP